MSTPQHFNYLTPLLYPLFALEGAKLTTGLNIQKILETRTAELFTGMLSVNVSVYRGGVLAGHEDIEIPVQDGAPETSILWRDFELSNEGFVEIHISSEKPIFRRIDLSAGYATISVPGYGCLTINADAKFARPLIIDQIRETQKFCLSHGACFWDEVRNIGTSIFFVNPYEQDIVATVSSAARKNTKMKLKAKQARTLPLADVLNPGEWGTIMITANNRIPAWILSHSIDHPLRINRADHLDLFRADHTYGHVDVATFIKSVVRKAARKFGKVI